MGKKMVAGVVVGALAVLLAWGGLSLSRTNDVHAQARGYEYAFLLPVSRLESYEIDLSRWAGKPADKEYHETHVFAYEEGSSEFERRVNCLRRMNELGAQGWDMIDAKAGVLRRAK
jgi:hypothetical protein